MSLLFSSGGEGKKKIPFWPFKSRGGVSLSKHRDETSRRRLATRLSSEEVVRREVTIEEKVLIALRGLVIIILLIRHVVVSYLRSFLLFFLS